MYVHCTTIISKAGKYINTCLVEVKELHCHYDSSLSRYSGTKAFSSKTCMKIVLCPNFQFNNSVLKYISKA